MRNAFRLAATAAVAMLLSGCYINLGLPTSELTVSISADKAKRQGSATCTGFFGVFATGDCSVTTAMENGRISKVHHVDSEFQSVFFGAYSEYTVVVHGE